MTIVTPKADVTVQSPVVVVFETPADLSMMTMGKHAMPMGPHLHVELDRRLTMPTFQQMTRLSPTRYQMTVGSAAPRLAHDPCVLGRQGAQTHRSSPDRDGACSIAASWTRISHRRVTISDMPPAREGPGKSALTGASRPPAWRVS